MQKIKKLRIINFLLFYIGWYFAVKFHNLLAAGLVIFLAYISSMIMSYKMRELIIIIVLALLGCISDVISYTCDLYSFTYTKHLLVVNNVWLISLWILFLTTFNGSLKQFKNTNIYLLSMFGFLGGISSYFLANKLNVIYFPAGNLSLIYIGMIWAIVFPCLYKAYHRIL